MDEHSGLRKRATHLLWRLLSVPLYTKILSVVVVGGFLFGAVTLFEVWTTVVETHTAVAQDRGNALGDAVADRIDAALAANDLDEARHIAELATDMFPGCVYVHVQDGRGRSLLDVSDPEGIPDAGRDRGVREVVRTLTGTAPGTVRLGIVDPSLDRQMSEIIWPIVWTLGICLLVSELLAVLWARLLVSPIHNLVQATHRIQEGDFETRARVYADDEVGQLAAAFNAMAESLQRYRNEVREKEAARQSLLAKIVQAQEEERKVVSRELHDQLGQSLSKVLLSLQSVHRECGCANTRCSDVETDIRDAIDEVRRLAWAMRPSILDDYGLEAALGKYIRELSKRVDFPVDYQCFSPGEAPRMPSTVEVTLYRVTQEAMTNIMRHAAPSRASVVLLRRGGEVTLVVEDDGCGFDLEKHRRNGHLGLISMEERVALIGGKLVIESRPGRGTAVRVRIPLNESAPCPSAS
jgi:signal transduction histidine kinase